MAKPRSPPITRGRKTQQPEQVSEDDDDDESSENDDSYSHQSENTSYTSSDSYRLHVNPRSDLSQHSNVNVNNVSETYKRSTRLDTSTSSCNDGAVNVSKSPTSLYPSLEEFKQGDTVKKQTESRKEYSHEGASKIYVEKQKDTRFISIIKWLALVAIGVAFGYCCYLRASKPSDNNNISPFDRFVSDVNNIEKILYNQNKRLWKTVKASTVHVLHGENSTYPVVILMAFPAQRAHISKCIAKKITSYYDIVHGLTPVESTTDISQLENLQPALQKETLDKNLYSAFSSNKRKSFFIENLQLLHPEAALLLHGYCDNDNAPYKDVMIVLLLVIDDQDFVDYNSADVENYLEQLWSRGLEVDKVKALLSRVANNVVTIEAEDDETFRKACL
uniref:Torsin-1A-interacting protein 1/2 AAA+ activator domain-containing protein n=1 Tax=Arion vulgaris TaxID=1028688 RepID=A0A0B6ZFX6_9EUPU